MDNSTLQRSRSAKHYKPGLVGTLKWYTIKFCASAKWILITTLAPETVIGTAFYDLLAAKIVSQKLQSFVSEDGVPCSLLHSYFANMGGFVIESGIREPSHVVTYVSLEDKEGSEGPRIVSERRALRRKRSSNHGREAHAILTPKVAGSPNEIPYCNPYHLTGIQIWQLRKMVFFPGYPISAKAS